MKFVHFGKMYKMGKAFFVKHSADILTGFTACGVVITALETRKATLRAQEYLRANGYDQANPDTQKVLKLEAAKNYIIPVATGGLTIGAAVGANYINHKQIAGLAAACTVAETALSEHRDKIEELMGEGTLKKLDDELLSDRAAEIMESSSDGPIPETNHGHILCLEARTGQRFYASKEWVYHARNLFNERINEENYASYGEFLEILWAGTNCYIPKEQYEVGYNIWQTGIMRLAEPHWEGDANEDAYMIFGPSNSPIADYMETFPKQPSKW